MKAFMKPGAVAVLMAAAGLAQTPTIRPGADGVVNNASYAPRGLPNSNIAQGSIFAVFGDNLGPATLAQQPSYPLQKTLGGTSIKVTVGGVTVDAIPIYTVKSQVGAVLPSNTPAGDGTVTVTFNGQSSATHPITVAANSFGAFSLNQQGSGPGVVTDSNFQPITVSNSAKPGQPIIIWGTGLGAISGDDAASPSPRDLTNIPVEVLIGGQTAKLLYRGRSGCCAGLDQVTVEVPASAQGCYVSMIVKINNAVSNITTLPVAAAGGTCSDANGLSSSELSSLLAKGSASVGSIIVGRTTTAASFSLPPGIQLPPGVTIPGATPTKFDSATAFFVKYTAQQLTASQGLFQQASIGSCIVTTVSGSAATRIDPVLPVSLNAGPTITMSTPSAGNQTLTRDAQFGFYNLPLSVTSFIPDNGGAFNFNNGSGGPDVGAFTTSLTVGAPLVWTNMDQITDVTRGNGVTVTWSGGDPSTFVEIGGTSTVINSGAASAVVTTFACTAPVSAQTFTVPSAVLLSLPVSTATSLPIPGAGTFTIPSGSLSVGNYTTPKKFTATGLDLAYVGGFILSSKGVNYK